MSPFWPSLASFPSPSAAGDPGALPTPQAWAVWHQIWEWPAPSRVLPSVQITPHPWVLATTQCFLPRAQPPAQPRKAGRAGRVPCSEGHCPPPPTLEIIVLALRTGGRWETPAPGFFSSPKSPPSPVYVHPPMLSGGRWPRSYDIKCSCTKTWPQSNYTRKQEEPLRLIWLLCLSLPRQRRRDAQEGQLSGWVAA